MSRGPSPGPDAYAVSGVQASPTESGLSALLGWVRRTREFRQGLGEAREDVGYFANVIDIGHGLGLAITTDGVGTKLLIAQMAGRYDTIGIDCVAMNVNDIICVGATPLSLVDCLSVEESSPEMLDQIGKGLYEGARQAQVNIVGGELAQVRDMVRGYKPGLGFDLTATCVGTVPLDEINTGGDVRAGDIVVGLRSSGLHSNGYSLVRKVLFDSEYTLDDRPAEIGRSLADELLEPTRIYVPQAAALREWGVRPKALANITGDGLLNLSRVSAEVGFVLDMLPEPHPIFRLVQEAGGVSDAEMYRVFNMGIGFCVVLAPELADPALQALAESGAEALIIGHAVEDAARGIRLPEQGLIGQDGAFRPI